MTSSNQRSIIGFSVSQQKAGLARRAGSFLADSGVAVACWSTLLPWSGAPLSPPLLHLAGALTLSAAIRALQRRFLGASLGDRLWALRSEVQPNGRRELRQSYLTQGMKAFQGALTAAAFAGLPAAGLLHLSTHHPSLSEGGITVLDTPAPASSAEWPNLPFYYLLGPWPATFGTKAVTYSLPYSKGPPHKFLGTIQARWSAGDLPEALVSFEGPRTPEGAPSPQEARDCFVPDWRQRHLWRCLARRESLLRASLDSLRRRFDREDFLQAEVGWFETPGREADSAQGIRIRVASEKLIDERFIVLLENGTQQPIRFVRPRSARMQEMETTFLAALGAQRAQKDIARNRAWADQLLASVELRALGELEGQPARWEARAAEIEAFLIAKLTVEPTAVEPFFHLGGLATLFARHALRTKDPEWSHLSQGLLHSVIQYARDVSPSDARIGQLERLRGELVAPGDQITPRSAAPQRLPATSASPRY
jgi:hypothetical protein